MKFRDETGMSVTENSPSNDSLDIEKYPIMTLVRFLRSLTTNALYRNRDIPDIREKEFTFWIPRHINRRDKDPASMRKSNAAYLISRYGRNYAITQPREFIGAFESRLHIFRYFCCRFLKRVQCQPNFDAGYRGLDYGHRLSFIRGSRLPS